MEHISKSDIKCPFFMNMKRELLSCEGYIENTCMTTKFTSMAAATEHMNLFCKKEDGGKCPLALNLFDKYERMEKLAAEHDKRKEIYNRG